MQLVGSAGQNSYQETWDASGTITSGSAAQLILPRTFMRSYFFFQNTSANIMLLEFGSARATATITNGVVTSVAVTNAGFGFSYAPLISFVGGGTNTQNGRFLVPGIPPYSSPANVATARCIMTGSAPNMTVASIVVDNGGSGYKSAPYVRIQNDQNDPFGCCAPSATIGIQVPPNGGNISYNGTFCLTDSISVFCATSTSTFVCKYAL